MEQKIKRAILAMAFLAFPLPVLRATTSPPAAAGREPLTLVRVANAGVMLSSGGTKVLIDALFDQAPADYRSPEPEVIGKIVAGAAPFDGVGLALVTHNHPDHFSAPLAVRFLEANPAARLLAPEDAAAEMRKEKGWASVAPRVMPLDLKMGEMAEREIAGVSLAARRTLHSGKKEEPMNLMARLLINGWSVFHEGDADATLDEYRGFGLDQAKVDLALVHFWFPLHPEMAKLLQEVIRPAHVGLTHLPIRLEGDAPGKIDMVRQYYKDIFLMLPGMPAMTFEKEAASRPAAVAEDPAGRAEVRKAIEQSIGWAVEKDFEAMFRLWGDDLFHFWLFSDSQVVGLENFRKYAEQWRDPDFRGTRFEFRDLRIMFSRSGDVAWYSCFLDDCGSFKGKESCLKDVFQTGVLEKRDGRWVHVLMHGSYPVDKVPEKYVRHFYGGLFQEEEKK